LAAPLRWVSRFRDWFLIVFIATAYFLLPVLGCTDILVIMGFAQCNPTPTRTRIADIAFALL
jgi:hypothetical protein